MATKVTTKKPLTGNRRSQIYKKRQLMENK